tara:strand:+ start:402 stop:662 length:261 start_codon:yes stop_codon:yes gene_type:complete
MDINQLSEILKKKLLNQTIIESIEVQDKSFLHKHHKTNEKEKFHIVLIIKSSKLKKKNKIESNRFIYKVIEDEMKFYIHSLIISFI